MTGSHAARNSHRGHDDGRLALPRLLRPARRHAAPPLRGPPRRLPRWPAQESGRSGIRVRLRLPAPSGPSVPLAMPPRRPAPLFLPEPRGRSRAAADPEAVASPLTPAIADRGALDLSPGRSLRTRVAGLFLFLPLLARLRFDELVRQADYPGSDMVPAPAALLALLTLKLLDKERRGHINDFNFDEAAGLFAGLNVLPKKSFATDYSYRTGRACQRRLLEGWVRGLAPLLFPAAGTFSVDFHPLPFRGDPTGLDRHYLPLRGRAGPSVLTF